MGVSKNWQPFNPQGGEYDISGWFAGGQIGVNAQSGRFVAGVEVEAVWTKIDGDATFPFVTTNTVTLASQMKWLAMVTGRIGYTPFIVGLSTARPVWRLPMSTTIISGSRLRLRRHSF